MADFGGFEYALPDRWIFATDAGTYDSGDCEDALPERIILVATGGVETNVVVITDVIG